MMYDLVSNWKVGNFLGSIVMGDFESFSVAKVAILATSEIRIDVPTKLILARLYHLLMEFLSTILSTFVCTLYCDVNDAKCNICV